MRVFGLLLIILFMSIESHLGDEVVSSDELTLEKLCGLFNISKINCTCENRPKLCKYLERVKKEKDDDKVERECDIVTHIIKDGRLFLIYMCIRSMLCYRIILIELKLGIGMF